MAHAGLQIAERRRWRVSRGLKTWGTGLLFVLGIGLVVANLGRGDQFAALLKQARPAWLLVALALQVATYVCAAGVWYRALVRQGEQYSLHNLYSLGLAKLFMDQALPSAGLSGSLLVTRGLRRRGIPRGAATTTVVAGLLVYYLSYAVALGAGLVALWWSASLSRYIILAAALFTVFIALIPAGILWLSRSGRRLPHWLAKIRPLHHLFDALSDRSARVLRDPLFLLEGTALQLGVIVLDAATLGVVLLALGAEARPVAVFANFAVASAIGALSPLPGGLGSLDATLIALLRVSRVPLETAVSATILLRGFTLLLPLIPGLWLARAEGFGRGKNEQAAPRADAA